ncbi:MAG TPA: hypothetical protein DIC35_03620 [Candidatus Moranbacteria bacterium]|nr:hypothetical protein [Candidatus Moranbacteria bacterium]
MIKELQLIGLGKNEATIYEALVKYGPCKAGVLIAKLDIHRNLVYQSLEKLIREGYVTKVSTNGVWIFHITDPHSLLGNMRQKESMVTQIIKEIQKQHHNSFQQIVVYEGLESYRNYWISSLERFPNETVDYTVGIEPTDKWIEIMGSSFERYLQLRVKKKIKWQTILFKVTESERKTLEEYPELTEYRLWQQDVDFIGNFNVIHDTVILQVAIEPYRIIEIRDKNLVSIFKLYFDMMWEKSEPVVI